MAFEPNEEQKLFLNSRDCNVLVSASAGSGKTSTMIQKLMKILIEEKVSIGKLLVLTFTEAAASEIKQKLFSAISENMESASVENRQFLKQQLDNINSAEIGTLHSVCKKLIVKYFYEIGESPDFAMLSERESKYLLDYAMNNVFEKYIKSKDEGFFELYDCYNSKRNDENLKKLLLSLLDYLRNKCDYKDWIQNTMQRSFETSLKSNIVCEYLMKYAQEQICAYAKELDDLLVYARGNSLDKYIDFLARKRQFVDEITGAKDFPQIQKILFNSTSITKPRKSKNDDELTLQFDEMVDVTNKKLAEEIKSIKNYFVCGDEEETIKHLNQSRVNCQKFVTIVEDILAEYSRLKKLRNCLDFNDLEDKMIELLRNEKIVTILKNNYQFVFFDEYQDINEKQEYIISKLVSQDNYYMIGDVKQSIYAFRQSSPKIFVSKFYKFNLDGKKNKVINFNRNYRSDKNILAFNNIVFDELITEETIGINYKQNSQFQSDKEYKGCNVDMRIVDAKPSEKEDSDEDIDKDEKEAIMIGNEIAKLLVTKKEDGGFFEYRDIAIILRKRGTFVKTLCDVLGTMQIPIYTTISSDFFASFEINLMMAIAQIGVNFKNDIALSCVLKNLFEFSDEELFLIRKNSDKKYFFECFLDYEKDNVIATKKNKFFDFLNSAKDYLSCHTTMEYFQMVVDKFDILINLKSMKDGKEKIQNINEFISLADNDNYKYNIDKFVEYLNFISSENQLQKVGNIGNSVQIMTIHYSKGLEYPAVIFAGLGKKFNINKDTNDIIINENFGFGLKSIDSSERVLSETIVRNACKIDNRKSEINEEIRLLYVAMTRAKEKLILLGTYNLDTFQNNRGKKIYNLQNYFDMIFRCVPNKYIPNFENRIDFLMNENMDSCCNVSFIKSENILLDNTDQNNLPMIGDCDQDTFKIFADKINKKVNTQTFTIKNTVTNILSEEKDYENTNYYPKKLDSSDAMENIDALKLGTAYHSVMQNLKFTENKAEIEELIKRLIKENVISEEYAKLIKVEEIFQAKEVLKDLITNCDMIFKEKQFVMQQNYNKIVKNSDNNTKVVIQGIIDLVVVKDGNAYLIDYKTNKTNNEDFLRSNYSLQLEIYSQAFEKATNIAITKKFLYSFCMGKLIEVN